MINHVVVIAVLMLSYIAYRTYKDVFPIVRDSLGPKYHYCEMYGDPLMMPDDERYYLRHSIVLSKMAAKALMDSSKREIGEDCWFVPVDYRTPLLEMDEDMELAFRFTYSNVEGFIDSPQYVGVVELALEGNILNVKGFEHNGKTYGIAYEAKVKDSCPSLFAVVIQDDNYRKLEIIEDPRRSTVFKVYNHRYLIGSDV